MRPQSKAAPVLPDHLFRALLPILFFTAAETLMGQGRSQGTNMKAIKIPLLVLVLILAIACDADRLQHAWAAGSDTRPGGTGGWVSRSAVRRVWPGEWGVLVSPWGPRFGLRLTARLQERSRGFRADKETSALEVNVIRVVVTRPGHRCLSVFLTLTHAYNPWFCACS
jgi:hypothetical protein